MSDTFNWSSRPVPTARDLSLRDYFAGQALNGCLSYSHCDANGNWQNNSRAEDLAEYSYRMADEMLKAGGYTKKEGQ